MTCAQLGGACDLEFKAENFDDMANLSKKHGMEMYQKGDEAHILAMKNMMELMKSPAEMNDWFEAKKNEFDLLPNS